MSFFAKKDREVASKESSFKKVLDMQDLRNKEHSRSKSLSRASRFSKSNYRNSGVERESKLRVMIEENQKAMAKLQTQMRR